MSDNVFQIDPVMNVDKYIKTNDCPKVTNYILFESEGVPTKDGLLSYELFGTSIKDRSNIFGYIELNDVFLHPLVYKIWNRMDSTISKIVWSDIKWSVNSKGEIVEDEKGESGVRFLKNNLDKIKIRSTSSDKRDKNIKFIKSKGQDIFIDKLLIAPPYIRDILVSNGKTEVGELNKFYQKIMINASSLSTLSDYGINTDYLTKGRIQEELVNLYNWLTKEPNLGQKRGIIRRAVLSKTVDYSSRLVISAPDLHVESVDDLVTTLDYCTMPLDSLCGNLKPFLLFWLRNCFNNLFSGTGILVSSGIAPSGVISRMTVDEFEQQFNDERYEKEISRFIEGYANRFIPISFKDSEGRTRYFGIGDRPITWCELFYIALEEIVQGKHAIITRYPVDSYNSEFPCKIRVSSTNQTEERTIGNHTYKRYPLIRKEDLNSDTSNKFEATLTMFNTYLGAIGGDYDGDQVTVRVLFSEEANIECDKKLNSKINYISLGGDALRSSSNECIQAMYNLTLVLNKDKDKLSNPKFA